MITNKKIIILGPAHPLRGGLAAFNERLARELQQQGNEVRIETFSFQYPSFMFPGKTQYAEGPAPEGLHIRRSVHSMNPLNWILVGRRLRQEAPDLIIVAFWLPLMGPSLGTVVKQAKKNGKTRVVGLIHNLVPHEKRPGDVPFTRYFVQQCDAFITLSQEVLNDLRGMTNKPAVFSPHPVYDSFGDAVPKQAAMAALGLSSTYRYLLFFGFVRDYKGLDLLLQAMGDPRLTARQDVRLVVAGEFYEDRAPYEALVNQFQLKDKLVMANEFIPNEMVKYYFSAADIVVQPYRSATQSGISQMAYHFGKPMVVTNVGGLPEIVPDGKAGYVVAPEPAAIAEGILRLLEEGPDRFSDFVASQKQRYSWANFTEALGNLAAMQ
ncbi:glycosyltransferase [Chitinophaga sedimenti]|uniref:glycosyltransferase n=1 Tax=Chitinophaga sedimenti TaxID=2033606 RepID=UPI002003A3F8|nr:glycosyltransferase [Chitinophaga sedimenti]MCK7554616.1 glycosyltransferase [Chitinophaga sedimenti]